VTIFSRDMTIVSNMCLTSDIASMKLTVAAVLASGKSSESGDETSNKKVPGREIRSVAPTMTFLG
jgi:hypothetical protein